MIQLLLLFCKASNVTYKNTSYTCNLAYIGKISNYLHIRINQHRSVSYKFSPSANYFKSTIELQHFNLHNFKNIKIDILYIKKI